DLALGAHEGNCDLCFLKGVTIRRARMRARPEAAVWWIAQEAAIGATFRSKASASYAQIASAQPLPLYADDALTEIECVCHDWGGGPMPDATRTFNGLTGAEIRTRLLQELEARLRDDTRLGAHLVFPVVTWTWRLELEASPPAGAGGPGAGGGLRGGVRGRVRL